MESDGITRVYVGHPLRVSGDSTSKVSATEIYPSRGSFDADASEEAALAVWANADVQLKSARYYTNDEGELDIRGSTLSRFLYFGRILETGERIEVEDGLLEVACDSPAEHEVIARSVESQLGKTGLTIMCE